MTPPNPPGVPVCGVGQRAERPRPGLPQRQPPHPDGAPHAGHGGDGGDGGALRASSEVTKRFPLGRPEVTCRYCYCCRSPKESLQCLPSQKNPKQPRDLLFECRFNNRKHTSRKATVHPQNLRLFCGCTLPLNSDR